jgi:hypothetical protein
MIFQLKKEKIFTSFEYKEAHIWNNLIHFLLQFICSLNGAHGDQLAGIGSRSVSPRRPLCQHNCMSLFCSCSAARVRGQQTGSDRMATAKGRDVAVELFDWCLCGNLSTGIVFAVCFPFVPTARVLYLLKCACVRMAFHTDANETTPKVTAQESKCFFTNKLTPWSGVLRDNLTGPKLVRNLPALQHCRISTPIFLTPTRVALQYFRFSVFRAHMFPRFSLNTHNAVASCFLQNSSSFGGKVVAW